MDYVDVFLSGFLVFLEDPVSESYRLLLEDILEWLTWAAEVHKSSWVGVEHLTGDFFQSYIESIVLLECDDFRSHVHRRFVYDVGRRVSGHHLFHEGIECVLFVACEFVVTKLVQLFFLSLDKWIEHLFKLFFHAEN